MANFHAVHVENWVPKLLLPRVRETASEVVRSLGVLPYSLTHELEKMRISLTLQRRVCSPRTSPALLETGKRIRIFESRRDNCLGAAVRGLFQSISLGQYQHRVSALFQDGPASSLPITMRGNEGSMLQDVLRLLTLWFTWGHCKIVQRELRLGFPTVDVATWLLVLPQLIARMHLDEQADDHVFETLEVQERKAISFSYVSDGRPLISDILYQMGSAGHAPGANVD